MKCSRNFLSILRPKAFRVRQFGWPDQVSASSSANKRRIGANKKKPAFAYSINWAAGDNYRPRGQERKKPWRALVIFSRLCQLFKVDEFFLPSTRCYTEWDHAETSCGNEAEMLRRSRCQVWCTFVQLELLCGALLTGRQLMVGHA